MKEIKWNLKAPEQSNRDLDVNMENAGWISASYIVGKNQLDDNNHETAPVTE